MKRLLFFLLVSLLISSIANAQGLPKRWQYGDPVYGHEANWNFDYLEADRTISFQAATGTFAVASSSNYLTWETGATFYQLPLRSITQFKSTVSAISASGETISGDISGSVVYTTGSGTAIVGSLASTLSRSDNATAWDVIASCSAGGKLHLIASLSANVKVNSRSTLVTQSY